MIEFAQPNNGAAPTCPTTGSVSAGTDYQYDAFGNLTGRSAFAGSAYQGSFTPDANNQDSTSPYDAAGDLLNDGVNSYSYDAEGRITSVSGATAYQYDAEGRRVAVGPVGQMPTTDYLYDLGGTLVTSVGSDFKMVRSSLYVAGSHWADYTQGTGSGGGRTQYRLGDEVGTLVYTFDQNGNPLEQCLSGPFGEALQCSPSVDYTETHFADKKRDQESNLDYMGARFYSSTLGRFMTPDPSGLYYADPTNPQSLNLYSYGQNNPLSNTDPTGLTCQTNDNGDVYDDLDGNGCDQVDQQNANSGPQATVNATFDQLATESVLVSQGIPCSAYNAPAAPISYAAVARANAKMSIVALVPQFMSGGKQDYKGKRAFGNRANQVAVGNFAFGATGAARGWSFDQTMKYAGYGAELSNALTQIGGVLSQTANMEGQYGVSPNTTPQGMPASTLGPGSPGHPVIASNGIATQGDQDASNENQAVANGYLAQAAGCTQ